MHRSGQITLSLRCFFYGGKLNDKYWEHFHHQADIGVRGIGATISEAFEQGALALMAVICKPQTIALDEIVEIQCSCDDMELLFADWLNAVIYEIATRRMLFGKFEVQIENEKLTACL